MASTETGEMFTQEQFDAMTVQERASLGLVRITPQEQAKLEPMPLEERKQWLKKNKNKPTRRQLNKRERLNRKAGRRR